MLTSYRIARIATDPRCRAFRSLMLHLFVTLVLVLPSAVSQQEYPCPQGVYNASSHWPEVSNLRRVTGNFVNITGSAAQQTNWSNITITYFMLSNDALTILVQQGGAVLQATASPQQYRTLADTFILHNSIPGQYCLNDLLSIANHETLLGLITNTSMPLTFSTNPAGDFMVTSTTGQTASVVASYVVCNNIIHVIDHPLLDLNLNQTTSSLVPSPPLDFDIPSLCEDVYHIGDNEGCSANDQALLRGAMRNASEENGGDAVASSQEDYVPSPTGESSGGVSVAGIAVGVSCGVVALLVLVVVAVVLWRRRRKVAGHETRPGKGAAAASPHQSHSLDSDEILKTVGSTSGQNRVFSPKGGVDVDDMAVETWPRVMSGGKHKKRDVEGASMQLGPLWRKRGALGGRQQKAASDDNSGSSHRPDGDMEGGMIALSELRLKTVKSAPLPQVSGGSGGSGGSGLCGAQSARASEFAAVPSKVEDLVIQSHEIRILEDANGNPVKLGQGGFGAVYRGVRNGFQEVAVKLTSSDPGTSTKMQEQLMKEIGHLIKCRDPHIVQFLGVCFHEDDVMLITEFMPGGDLFRALTGRDTKETYMWDSKGKHVALDIAKGLCYLHSRHIAHFDLKPHNVLLDQNGNAKITDLGMSSGVSKGFLSHVSDVGTFTWAAPELLMGHVVSDKCDIYSFGVILWQMVTGEVPVRGRLNITKLDGMCCTKLCSLIETCMATLPEDRPSAMEVHDAIADMCRVSTPLSPTP